MPVRFARLLAAVGLVTTAAHAQQPPVTRLARPDARLPHEFSSITGLLELADGRVLVSDGIDETVLRVDLRTMKIDTVGRTGSGPGEYKTPDLIYPMPGGNIMLLDLGNARLSWFDATLKYLESAPIARGEPGRGMTMVVPDAVDGQGGIYFRAAGGGGETPPDSGAVVRWDRTRNVFDTVATIRLGEVKVTASGGANNRSVSMQSVPFSPEDRWSVAPDGRIAIARAADYHLEWQRARRTVVRGPAVPWRPVPIRDAEKREWATAARNGLAIAVTSDNGRMSVRMGRGGIGPGGRPRDDNAIPDLPWPASKPAFTSVRVSPEGDAWVERAVPAGASREYDVFGADGKIKRRVVIPAGRSLVGFGRGVIYLRETTEDDLQHLERYRLQS